MLSRVFHAIIEHCHMERWDGFGIFRSFLWILPGLWEASPSHALNLRFHRDGLLRARAKEHLMSRSRAAGVMKRK